MNVNKSKYEQMLEDILRKSEPVIFTSKQNDAILQELNKGMDDFLLKQRIIDKESAIELAGIVLNV